jgi:hypothetical protein
MEPSTVYHLPSFVSPKLIVCISNFQFSFFQILLEVGSFARPWRRQYRVNLLSLTYLVPQPSSQFAWPCPTQF